jgi:CRP/FNR family transcriptional regulator
LIDVNDMIINVCIPVVGRLSGPCISWQSGGREMPSQTSHIHAVRAAIGHGDGLLEKFIGSLPPEVSDTLLSLATLRDVEPGATVVERGVHSPDIGYVLDGTLAMIQSLGDGRKHIVGLLVPTDIFGRVFDGPSNYRIEAMTPVRVLLFPRTAFEQILRENPGAERLFLVYLLDETDAAREWLLLISGRKAVHRLASFLTILLRRSRLTQGSTNVVHVPLARKDLAHYLGARPETLSRAIHKLEQTGVLRIIDPNHFEIVDEEALIEASGDDLVVDGRAVR